MGARTYRPPRDDHVSDAGEMKKDYPHEISLKQLIPRIDEKNKRAVKTVRTPVVFFSKIKAGRQCSCWTVDSSADTLCVACYGTGIVGGYEKYGTHLEVIDVTHPNTRAINVLPDYSHKTKPRYFVLAPGAKHGKIVTRVYLKTNISKLDAVKFLKELHPGTELKPYIQSPADSEPVPLTKSVLEQRLNNPWIDISVEFSRPSIHTPSPLFGVFYLRYKRLEKLTVLSNVPRAEKANLLSEMGVTDDWSTMRLFLDSTIRSITTEDFFVSDRNATKWKITRINESNPEDYLLSWDLDTRLIKDYEPLNHVPV